MTSPTKFLDNCFSTQLTQEMEAVQIQLTPHHRRACIVSTTMLSVSVAHSLLLDLLLKLKRIYYWLIRVRSKPHTSQPTHMCVCNRIYLSRHFARWQLCKSWFPVFRLRDYASIMALIRPFIKLVSNYPGRRWIHTGQKHGCTIHLSGAICSVYMQAMSFTTWIPIINALLKNG